MKYRKRPIVVEAFQMTPENCHDIYKWPEWLKMAAHLGSFEPWPNIWDYMCGRLQTLEGSYGVAKNDYIIQGIKGELYPCKPDIFERTYEKVEDDDPKDCN
jgi:hypothetical protein